MSFQEFSDGTLPDYFHNLWRKKFMTEEEIEKEKKVHLTQLKKLKKEKNEKKQTH